MPKALNRDFKVKITLLVRILCPSASIHLLAIGPDSLIKCGIQSVPSGLAASRRLKVSLHARSHACLVSGEVRTDEQQFHLG